MIDLHFEQGPKLLSTTSFSLSQKTIRFGAEYNFRPFFRVAVSAASDDAGLPAKSGGLHVLLSFVVRFKGDRLISLECIVHDLGIESSFFN